MPAFRPGPPRRLGAPRHVSVWAPVSQATAVRAAPRASAAAVARLSPRTPEATRNVVAVLRRRTRSNGAWVRVALAVLPNGSTGWVPRSALGGYGTLRTRLEVDLARMRATLFRDGTAVFRAAVGVGRTATPTPAGSFYVRNRLSRYRSPTYGPVAFHGTDRPDLIPGRISHGCIRMANADILELARRMPVGTPVDIR
jgi:lipoprotein-anchoring transpeptidase ErfK/SrfK